LRPEALLVLGDDAFDRGQLEEAETRFAELLKGSAGQLTGVAHHKQAWVKVNQGECPAALKHFEAAIRSSQRWISAHPGAERAGLYADLDVRRTALIDMMFCFATDERSKNGAAILPFLESLAYARGPLIAALEKLSNRYSVLELSDGLLAVSRALLRLAPDRERRESDAFSLHSSLVKLNDFRQVGDDVALITRALSRRLRSSSLSAEAKAQLLNDLEVRVRDLAVRAQQARRDQSAKAPSVDQSERAYRLYLNQFPESEARVEVLDNLAQLLAKSQRHYDAGRAYYSLMRATKGQEGATYGEAGYQTVLAFQRALEKSPLSQFQRVVARASLRRAGTALLGSQQTQNQGQEVRFAVAQTYYDEGRYSEAIEALTAVIVEAPASKQGTLSTSLVLDAYRNLNDFQGLAAAGRRLQKLPLDPALQAQLSEYVAAADQRHLDELALSAAGRDGGDVTGDLERFATQNAGSSLGERALLNAFVAARSEGLVEKLYAIGERIQREYPQSSQLPGVLGSIARAAAGRFEIDRALQFFRSAAANASQRALLLNASARLLAALGDDRGALEQLKPLLDDDAVGDAVKVSYGRHLLRVEGASALAAKLAPFAEGASPELMTLIAYGQVSAGQYDEGEGLVEEALSAEINTPDIRALALYTQGELYYNLLRTFQPSEDIEEVAEWVTILELVEQGFLKAIQAGDPHWSTAALGRLAHAVRYGASKIGELPIPADYRARFAARFKQRAAALSRKADQAVAACRAQGIGKGLFSPAVRDCFREGARSRFEVPYDQLKGRGTTAPSTVGAEARRLLDQNSEDGAALLRLGEALLDAGDPHLARMALAKGLAQGEPQLLNLYGVACAEIGDWSGALQGFGRAALAGLEAGVKNGLSLLKERGLTEALTQASARWEVKQSGGRLRGGVQ
ncbi:MAG: hypothetical protein VYD19_06540, partial [Myxococcota bacterium]|nr:hypothetical protein [Myxococcota bacterium]